MHREENQVSPEPPSIPERAAEAQAEAGRQLIRDIAIDRILDPPRTYPPFKPKPSPPT